MLQRANIFVLFALLVGGVAQFARKTSHGVEVNGAGDVTGLRMDPEKNADSHEQFSRTAGMLARIEQHEVSLQGGGVYECDDGFDLVEKTCFQFHANDAKADYIRAKQICEARPGATLATINDEDTENGLVTLATQKFGTKETQFHFGLRNTLNSTSEKPMEGNPIGPMYWESGEEVSSFAVGGRHARIKRYLTEGDTAVVKCAIMTYMTDDGPYFDWDHDDCKHISHFMCSYKAPLAATPAPAPKPDLSGTYTIQLKQSDWYLGAETEVPWQCYTRDHANEDTKWTLEISADGSYTVKQVSTKRYLSAENPPMNESNPTMGNSYPAYTIGGANQSWIIEPAGSCCYTLKQSSTNLILGGQGESGVAINSMPPSAPSQQWILTKVKEEAAICNTTEGWTQAGGECYKFTLFEKHEEPNVKYTHDMAEELCHAMGPTVHLATINSDEANKVVADLVGKHTEVHIGLKYTNGLAWESGQPVKYEASWFNFTEAPGQNYVHKTDAAGECTRISGSTAHWNPSGWDDWPCADALRDGYVCSFSAKPTPAPAPSPTPPAPTNPRPNCVVEAFYEWKCAGKVIVSCETNGAATKECIWGSDKGDDVYSVRFGAGCSKVTMYDDDGHSMDGDNQNVPYDIGASKCEDMISDLQGDTKGAYLESKA